MDQEASSRLEELEQAELALITARVQEREACEVADTAQMHWDLARVEMREASQRLHEVYEARLAHAVTSQQVPERA